MPHTLAVSDLRTDLLGPVSFSVPARTWCRVEGPSGSGKTLLLRALADLDEHAGTVTLGGVEQQSFPAHQWRRQVQYVPTESAWWAPTVGEHFSSAAAASVQRLGFQSDVWSWPVERLSTGERQRLALVRALSLEPQVLLLDEAWSHVDPSRRSACVELVQQRADAGAAVVAVAHDEALPVHLITQSVLLRNRRQVTQ